MKNPFKWIGKKFVEAVVWAANNSEVSYDPKSKAVKFKVKKEF